MTKIYAYGVIDSQRSLGNTVNGLEGARVYNIPYCDIGVAASDVDWHGNGTRRHIFEHEEVVEKLMGTFTVLPISFRTVFDKKDDLLSIVEGYYSDFKRNLDKLRNKQEFGIKVIWPADAIRERIINACSSGNSNIAAPGDSPGRDFMRRKLKEYQADREFREEAGKHVRDIDAFFCGLAAEKKIEMLKSDSLLLNASYLVDRDKEAAFRKAWQDLRRSLVNCKYLFSGPWPPYNFVSLARKPWGI